MLSTVKVDEMTTLDDDMLLSYSLTAYVKYTVEREEIFKLYGLVESRVIKSVRSFQRQGGR